MTCKKGPNYFERVLAQRNKTEILPVNKELDIIICFDDVIVCADDGDDVANGELEICDITSHVNELKYFTLELSVIIQFTLCTSTKNSSYFLSCSITKFLVKSPGILVTLRMEKINTD